MPGPKSTRLAHRLLTHHLPLLVLTAAAVAALYRTRPYPDIISRASFATAYPALALLLATLVLGPWRVLTRRRNPVSEDLRRDLGIWAGLLSLAHSVIGQCVHLRGRPWLYYLYEPRSHHTFPLRHDLFGFANLTGLLAALIVLALLATSNDYSLRTLGTPQWKQLQRWNYAAFALTALHAIGYLSIEKQKLPWVTTIALGLAIALTLQLLGLQRRRTQQRNPQPATS